MPAKYIIIAIFFISFFSGCIEEPTIPVLEVPTAPESADAATFIDAQNHFRAVDGQPVLVDHLQLYFQYRDWYIIDLRSVEEFTNGHIEYAVNIDPHDLLIHLSDLELEDGIKIALVCKDGQISSFMQCFARISGFANIYTLHFGMASWNPDFAETWKTNSILSPPSDTRFLDNAVTETPGNYPMPPIGLIDANSTPQKMKARINEVLENTDFHSGTLFDESSPFISMSEMNSYYNHGTKSFDNMHIYCYDLFELYLLYTYGSPLSDPSHPRGAINIMPPLQFDYRLASCVQKIDSDIYSVIYSSDGHSSAFLTALLRVLGYNAKSMLYGANVFGGNIMQYAQKEIQEDVYNYHHFFNLPYEK